MQADNKPTAPNGQINIQDTTTHTGNFYLLEPIDAVFSVLKGKLTDEGNEIDLISDFNLSTNAQNLTIGYYSITEIKLASGEVMAYRN